MPVAFAIALSAVCTILYEGLPLAVLFQQMMSGMNVFSFLAIPFFVLNGELMLHGGIADKIVAAARNMVGHVRGGLGMSNVVSCTLFGGVAGSPVADVSAMGSVMIPMMKREGYDADYAVNVTTHAALVGALVPTSHNMIIYALAAGGAASIGSLILAGIVPAILLTVCNLAAAYYVAIKRGYPALPKAHRRHPVALDRGSGAGAAGHRHHPGRHHLRCVHGDGVGLGRGDLLYPADLLHLSHDELGALHHGGRQGGQDHRRDPAADRRLDDVPVPHGALLGGRHGRRVRCAASPRIRW